MGDKLRVMHVVRTLDPGGLESVVINLTNGFLEEKITSYLGCLFEAGSRRNRVRVEEVWTGRLHNRPKASVLLSFCRYLKKKEIDLIHSHNPHPHLLGVAASLLTGIPVIHTKHGRNYPDNPRRVWLNRQLARLTQKVVAVSEDVARVAIEIEKVPSEKVTVIRNGVGVGNWKLETGNRKPEGARWRDERGIAKDAFVVGSVGRLAPEKNYELLIRAFARLRAKRQGGRRGRTSNIQHSTSNPSTALGTGIECDEGTKNENACPHQAGTTNNQQPDNPATKQPPFLLLVGEGPEREKLEKLIDELGIRNHCKLPGMQEDVTPWLKCMDVFCLSSVTEGTSITLLEAGACGVPAVVTDVGGNAEIVEDGRTGIVAPGGDEEAMAEAFERLAGDKELRERMGEAARQRIEQNYSVDEMVRRYAELYREVLGA